MKRLLYFPIVHNQTDLGSLGQSLSAEGGKKYGAAEWQEHIVEVDRAWNKIENEISGQLKQTTAEKLKIYQDGLPVVDATGIQIVKDTAQKGSINYAIIDRLLMQGAKLELAENIHLLMKEYQLLSDVAKAETQADIVKAYLMYTDAAAELLSERDAFIANQINTTLKEGETGIAFFGAAHSITDKLNKDITVDIIRMFTDSISIKLTE